MAKVRGRVFRGEITPPLKRTRSAGYSTNILVGQENGAGGSAILPFNALQADNRLTHGDDSFDHPIERTAVKNLGGAPRCVPGNVTQDLGLAVGTCRINPGTMDTNQMIYVLDADAELDEMDRHAAFQSVSARATLDSGGLPNSLAM